MDYFWVVQFISNIVLSKNKIKLISSLDQKKNRLSVGLFVAEGKKLVSDLLQSDFAVSEVFCTNNIALELSNFKLGQRINILDKEELSKISFLKTTPEIIALCEIPNPVVNWDEISHNLTLVLDEIQDPGNLGTIIRLADWFGIRNIICSENCADLYNPKVVQATMGAFTRVRIHYVSLTGFLEQATQLKIPVYGAFLEGENIYQCELTENGLLVMGNEGKGISDKVSELISRKINIPSYPDGVITSESLNVAVATSVICSEFRRRIICKG